MQRSKAAVARNEGSERVLENRIRGLVAIDDVQYLALCLGKAQLKRCLFCEG